MQGALQVPALCLSSLVQPARAKRRPTQSSMLPSKRATESQGAPTRTDQVAGALLNRGRTLPRRHFCQAQQATGALEEELLQAVLSRIQKSDSGLSLTPAEQEEVNTRLALLEELGKQQVPRPLESDDLWGNFEVAYTSTLGATDQKRQPAGGGFRSGFGRRIFRTKQLCQSLLKPDTVINKVEFSLLGIISGFVGLRGKLEPVGDNGDTVKVNFEAPRFSFQGGVDLAIGGRSSVQITSTYLTPQVRLGRGSRGSLFVFTKGAAADDAGMDQVGLGRTRPSGFAILAAIVAGLVLGARGLWRTRIPGWQAAGVLPLVLAAALSITILRNLAAQAFPQRQPQLAA